MTVDVVKRLAALRRNAEAVLDELGRGEPCVGEVCASFVSEQKAVYENDDFSVSSSSSTAMYGVRAIAGQRQGFATSNADDPEQLRACAREARNLARLSMQNLHYGVGAPDGGPADATWLDEGILAMAPVEVTRQCERVIEVLRQDARVAIDRAEFSRSVVVNVVMNSQGVAKSLAQASCSWSGMGMGKTADEVTSFDYDGATVSAHDTLAAEIDASMVRLRESLVGSLGARPGESYKGKVLLHPSAVADLLGGMVTANCSGLAHFDGTTAWKGKVGTQVASPLLHIYEDPQSRAYAAGWMPFDREGLTTRRHDLLKDGVLSFVAYDGFTARKAGVAPTGNAHGSARGLPAIGFSNVVIEGSGATASDDEMMRLLGDGLVLKRFSGNEDTTSGHFSGIAKNSWWVKDGKRAFPVSQVMLAGNLFEVLQAVVAVGKKQHALFGSGAAPYVLVDGVSVTAA